MSYKHDMSGEKPPKRLLPTGWRRFKIIKCEEGTSKTGNEKFVFTVSDVLSGYAEELHLSAVQGKRWQLKKILGSLNLSAAQDGVYDWDIPMVIGREFSGLVEHEPNEYINRAGETVKGTQSRIVDFKFFSEDPNKKSEDVSWDDK